MLAYLGTYTDTIAEVHMPWKAPEPAWALEMDSGQACADIREHSCWGEDQIGYGTLLPEMYLCNAAIRESSAAMKTAQSLPGALKMDVKAHVMTSEDQRYTGHSQVQSQDPHHL